MLKKYYFGLTISKVFFSKIKTKIFDNSGAPNWRGIKQMPQSGVGSMQGSNEGRLPLKVIFHQRSSSTEGCLPPKVVFH